MNISHVKSVGTNFKILGIDHEWKSDSVKVINQINSSSSNDIFLLELEHKRNKLKKQQDFSYFAALLSSKKKDFDFIDTKGIEQYEKFIKKTTLWELLKLLFANEKASRSDIKKKYPTFFKHLIYERELIMVQEILNKTKKDCMVYIIVGEIHREKIATMISQYI